MIFGYARVSTLEQNLNSQLDILKASAIDEIICEKMKQNPLGMILFHFFYFMGYYSKLI